MPNVNPLKSIKTVSLRSQVYTQLKKELTMGTWKAGEKLPSEKDLCQSFGVSRVTVRGAIQQLEILGLVETRHGGGTFVKDFASLEQADAFHPQIKIQENRDLITVLEYRKIIEKGTVALAQKKTGPKDIAFLEETLKLMEDPRQSIETYAEADLAFHYRLARLTGNSIIIKVHEFINEILSTAMRDLVHQVGRNIGPAYHRKIINALKTKDKKAGETLMEQHMEANIRAIKKIIKARNLLRL
jgi:GntR family transcriptional repressor for pyruvate dehydrogenase complex